MLLCVNRNRFGVGQGCNGAKFEAQERVQVMKDRRRRVGLGLGPRCALVEVD